MLLSLPPWPLFPASTLMLIIKQSLLLFKYINEEPFRQPFIRSPRVPWGVAALFLQSCLYKFGARVSPSTLMSLITNPPSFQTYKPSPSPTKTIHQKSKSTLGSCSPVPSELSLQVRCQSFPKYSHVLNKEPPPSFQTYKPRPPSKNNSSEVQEYPGELQPCAFRAVSTSAVPEFPQVLSCS